jgi:hypothetical protein
MDYDEGKGDLITLWMFFLIYVVWFGSQRWTVNGLVGCLLTTSLLTTMKVSIFLEFLQ